jgi:hypothetical protein
MNYYETHRILSEAVTTEDQSYSGGYQGFTTFTVHGLLADVKAYCEHYVKYWHPAGYGTSVQEVTQKDDLGEGKGFVTYRVWHSNSCD